MLGRDFANPLDHTGNDVEQFTVWTYETHCADDILNDVRTMVLDLTDKLLWGVGVDSDLRKRDELNSPECLLFLPTLVIVIKEREDLEYAKVEKSGYVRTGDSIIIK